MGKERVCVIGAGPSGMSVLYRHNEQANANKPDVVCYEKQAEWGGMWNYSWRTGTDEFGETCHNSMYQKLWINNPKEIMELPHYTFKEHYGKPLPSYLPRTVMKDYMDGLWNKPGKGVLFDHVKFNHVVRFVRFNENTENFTVIVSDLKNKTSCEETFSHVVVAAGIFSTPNKPDFPGIEGFKGRVIHSHDFRSPDEFKAQRILVIGGGNSAIDISVQLIKNGAKSVVVSHSQTSHIVQCWPEGIQERPIVKQIYDWSASFEDDTSADIDAIILCTGYLYSFPFMEQKLQMAGRSSFLYPECLYKGIIWIAGGQNKVFYMGTQSPIFTLPMYDIQANFVWKYILGKLSGEPTSTQNMVSDVQKWADRNAKVKTFQDIIDIHANYLCELVEMTGSNHKIKEGRKNITLDVVPRIQGEVGTFRDTSYASLYTGQLASRIKPWMENHDESITD